MMTPAAKLTAAAVVLFLEGALGLLLALFFIFAAVFWAGATPEASSGIALLYLVLPLSVVPITLGFFLLRKKVWAWKATIVLNILLLLVVLISSIQAGKFVFDITLVPAIIVLWLLARPSVRGLLT